MIDIVEKNEKELLIETTDTKPTIKNPENEEKDFLTKNFINNFLLEIKNSDDSLKSKLLNLEDIQKNIETSRILISKNIKILKNSDNEIFQNINHEIKNIINFQNDSFNLNKKVINKLFKNQNNLKNKIVSIFMHMDDRIILLKSEKKDLNKQLGMDKDLKNANSQKKYIKTLEREIFKLQKIINHKEKLIKKKKI